MSYYDPKELVATNEENTIALIVIGLLGKDGNAEESAIYRLLNLIDFPYSSHSTPIGIVPA